MATSARRSLKRATLAVALVCAAAPFAPADGCALAAQELPVGVAEDLVDRALEQQVGVTPVAATRGPGRVGMALSMVTIAFAVAVLVLGWNRAAVHADGSDAPAVGPVGTDPGAARARASAGASPGDDSSEPPGVSDERGSGSAPRSAHTLVLPPHVTAVLQREAERRRGEALAAGEGRGSGGPEEDGTAGFEAVVPGYDPWKKNG